MSANVGLSTPRGSGTSGYVQRNLSALKPRSTGAGQPYTLNQPTSTTALKTRKPDQTILNHDRLREIEVKVLELRDQLEEDAEKNSQEVDEEEIEKKCQHLRERLIASLNEDKFSDGRRRDRGGSRNDGKALKSYQVHELAEAKLRETDRLRKALGLRGLVGSQGAGVEGEEDKDEHPMARQERRRQERLKEMAEREKEVEKEHRRDYSDENDDDDRR